MLTSAAKPPPRRRLFPRLQRNVQQSINPHRGALSLAVVVGILLVGIPRVVCLHPVPGLGVFAHATVRQRLPPRAWHAIRRLRIEPKRDAMSYSAYQMGPTTTYSIQQVEPAKLERWAARGRNLRMEGQTGGRAGWSAQGQRVSTQGPPRT
jgi:hypothetical protein